ncbi:MAG: co-chaperone GroES [Alphaproteobacteria bacterium]|jgi:chaperonin GroES|nr:co-chaperone GroES [Alphaproteobacteria bacterium]
MKFKPLFNNILIERLEEENQTAGGIIIPDTAKEKPSKGVVIAVGEGSITENGTRITPDVKEGDVVIFGKWGGNDVKLDGKDFVIIKTEDILGIIE